MQAWAESLDKYVLTERCQTARVRAMPVQSNQDRVDNDPQLRARGMYTPAPHAVLGTWPIQSAPWKLSATPTPVDRAGPLCGQDNIDVLIGMLGLSHAELASGYEDNTFWPSAVPIEPYLVEALNDARV
ncbi:MAG: CoA transferase [Chloroflexota bacterium]